MATESEQLRLFETEATRSMLDRLISESRLYTQSDNYRELLDFVARMRNFAPFNAMLLQLQKPGLSFAASAFDWQQRFGRKPKEGARPLLIMWPFGPVALVYDVQDTEGRELPRDVWSFFAQGAVGANTIESIERAVQRVNVEWRWVDAGDGSAGWIRVIKRASKEDEANEYRMFINRNHPPAVQFTTVAHELAHLFLGHLGADKKLRVPDRSGTAQQQRELEAESVAFIVCKRNGVTSASETYLKNYVDANTTVDGIDVYQVMRATGQVEGLFGVTCHVMFEEPARAK